MTAPRIARTHELSNTELRELRTLLDVAFEDGFTDEDWEHTTGGIHVILGEDAIVSHAAIVERLLMAGERELRAGYVEGVATHPEHRERGHGSDVMRSVTGIIGGRYDIGALSTGIPSFYTRLGWERWQGPTYTRAIGDLVRTEEDDDSIMFLRTPATGAIDPTEPLSCEWRSGDVW